MRSATNHFLKRSVDLSGVIVGALITTREWGEQPELTARQDRSPDIGEPPSSAPTKLAVGFGPMEASPTLCSSDSPQDLLGPILGPPPPEPFWVRRLGSKLFLAWIYTPVTQNCQRSS